MAKYLVKGSVEYVQGHLRYGHYELKIDKEEWDAIPEEEKKSYLSECGNLVVDDYSVNFVGDITDISVKEVKR